MARFLVYATEAAAKDAIAKIDANGRGLYAMRGYTVDIDGSVIYRNLATGKGDAAAKHLYTWDIPRKRLDGKWVVLHPENHKSSQMTVDAQLSKAIDYIMPNVTSDSIETDPGDLTWFPIGAIFPSQKVGRKP